MKKLLCSFLVVLVVFVLTGCVSRQPGQVMVQSDKMLSEYLGAVSGNGMYLITVKDGDVEHQFLLAETLEGVSVIQIEGK